MKVICDGLLQLRSFTQSSPSPSDHSPLVDPGTLSGQCLELFLNAIQLDLLTGRPATALKRFEQARVTPEVQSTPSSFKGNTTFCIFLWGV